MPDGTFENAYYMSTYLKASLVPGATRDITAHLALVWLLDSFLERGRAKGTSQRGGARQNRSASTLAVKPAHAPSVTLPPAPHCPLQLCHYVPRWVAALVAKQLELGTSSDLDVHQLPFLCSNKCVDLKVLVFKYSLEIQPRTPRNQKKKYKYTKIDFCNICLLFISCFVGKHYKTQNLYSDKKYLQSRNIEFSYRGLFLSCIPILRFTKHLELLNFNFAQNKLAHPYFCDRSLRCEFWLRFLVPALKPK